MSNQSPMSQQILDALKAVSDRFHASHERRVGHELQAVVACLGLFAAATAFRLSTSFATNSTPLFLWVMLASFFGLCMFTTVYLCTSARSNRIDLEKARAADEDILDYLRQQSPGLRISAVVAQHGTTGASPSRNRWVWEIIVVWVGFIASAALLGIAK